MTSAERHLHSVPAQPRPLPWWCRTFGHRYISRPMYTLNPAPWLQSPQIPKLVMCSRCGSRP